MNPLKDLLDRMDTAERLYAAGAITKEQYQAEIGAVLKLAESRTNAAAQLRTVVDLLRDAIGAALKKDAGRVVSWFRRVVSWFRSG